MSGHQIDIPKALAEPGMIMRLNVGLGEQDRVFQIESFVDRDAQQSEIDEVAAKMMRAGDRLKARTQLPILRRQLDSIEFKHRDNLQRLAKLNASEQAANELRGQEIIKLMSQASKIQQIAQDNWIASGRRGEFKLQGGDKSAVARSEQAADMLKEQIAKESAEAIQQRSVLDNEIAEGSRTMNQLKRLIEEAEALYRGEDITGVAEG